MKKILSTIFIALAAIGTANAVVVQKVTLKNGSELNGYIQQQDGGGKMYFRTDNAIVYIKSNNASVYSRKVKIGSLNNAWKEWAEKNDAFTGIGDNRTLELNDVSFKYDFTTADSIYVAPEDMGFEDYLKESLKQVSNVKVLEQGVNVKYLELTPNTYVISWNDIESIRAERRPKTALSGINRIYELRNGKTYEGQYAEETDNLLSLYMDNGVVQSFKIDDVIKYTFRPVNPNQDIFEQSELTDIVKTKNGGETRGIIIEQNYASKKDSENYLLVQTESGAIRSIKVSEVSELRKEENPKYSPKSDIVLNEGDVVINRMETITVNVSEKNDFLLLDSISNKVVLKKGLNDITNVTVEYRLANGTNVEAFQLVKVTLAEVKKKKTYGFSYKDLVNSLYRPSGIETSVNNTTKAEYKVSGTGIYALYDAKKKKAIPFIIK